MWFLCVVAPKLLCLFVAHTSKAHNIHISGGVACSRCYKFQLRLLPFREGQMGDGAANSVSEDPDAVRTHLQSLTLSHSLHL